MIIDAHAHIFSSVDGLIGQGPVRGLDFGIAQIADDAPFQLVPPYNKSTTFPPEFLLSNMDWAGVDKAVLLQGSFYGERNEEVLAACQKYPQRFKGAAFFDPWMTSARAEFDRLFGTPLFPILKLELSDTTGLHGLHPGFQLDDPELDWLWAELERREINLTMDLGPVGGPSYQSAAVEKIAARHPNLSIVLCHLGFPTRSMDADPALTAAWVEQIKLGELSNIWFDLSALPHRAEENYPYPKISEWIRRAVEIVGTEKLMWGTDVPGVTSAGTYPQLLTSYQELLDDFSDSERGRIFGGTAAQVYKFV
ncbi:MAG: hypothetical protein CMJ72_15440 [Planctomycetaceae bacterium]|nr:hypothetical protein [Planctomycetaceae bacterium]